MASVGETAEKLVAKALWLAKKMATCGAVGEVVVRWGTAAGLGQMALASEPRLPGTFVRISGTMALTLTMGYPCLNLEQGAPSCYWSLQQGLTRTCPRGTGKRPWWQEGCIGLLRGARTFDSKPGFKLSTYVYWWINQAIIKEIAKRSRIVRLLVTFSSVPHLAVEDQFRKRLSDALGSHILWLKDYIFRALVYIHGTLGVRHRDIKPQNVLRHTRKDGKPTNEATKHVIEKLKSLKSAQPLSDDSTPHQVAARNDTYTQVLGPDRPGRVSGVGTGPTPTSMWGNESKEALRSENRLLMQRMMELETSMAEKFAKMESMIRGSQA
ncbi:hypothetical protein Taro_003039 [Colocasia esculenta]|uniref:RNA polymerase sigma-70 region 2 domain-containing protein n=1 Tax=Colocasia esculenta TaxID=4460 RepID=A0A843TI61_COLES|nr:hypothetical protein [Colocasia esculenta]